MIRIAGIEKESTVDGEGWRYVVFTQGCSHYCPECQNPETHDFNGGKLISAEDIIKDINSNPMIDGITLSGGDPFFQANELIDLCKNLKEQGYTVWAYTGFSFEAFLNFKNGLKSDSRINIEMLDLLRYVDVLVDGRFDIKQKTLDSPYIGSKNQRIINVRESLYNNKIIIYNI